MNPFRAHLRLSLFVVFLLVQLVFLPAGADDPGAIGGDDPCDPSSFFPSPPPSECLGMGGGSDPYDSMTEAPVPAPVTSSPVTSTPVSFAPSSAPTISPCPPGRYSTEGSAVCLACPVGTFSLSVGATSCTSCPDPRTYSAAGSATVESCKCPAGSFFDSKGGTCTACYPYYRNDDMTDTEVRHARCCCLRLVAFANPPIYALLTLTSVRDLRSWIRRFLSKEEVALERQLGDDCAADH